MSAITATPPPAVPSRGWLRTWVRAIRVFSFTASTTPILLGSALALYDGHLDDGRSVLLVVAMLLASMAVHAGCNLGNDYYDHRRGIDADVGAASDPKTTGPAGVIQDGSLTPAQVFRGMLVAFGIGTAIGIGIVVATGWPILLLALACLALAFLYTGGPKPLGYIALGEVTVFLTMGLAMIMGAYYVLTDEVTWRSFGVALPMALLVTAILHANNIADMATDRAAGKVTVANLFGRRIANAELIALVGGAWVAVAALVALEPPFWPALVAFAAVPRGLAVVALYRSVAPRPQLRFGVRMAAGLHMRFGLLMVAGLIVATILDRWLV